LRKGDVSESMFKFLFKYGSKPIKNSLKLIADGITYPIYGYFSDLEVPIDDEIEVVHFIARVDQPTFSSGRLQIVLEDGIKISNIHYNNFEFHEKISELYKSQIFVKFILSNKSNAKGKKICTLENVS
jgi:hypothetical protein